MRLTDLDARFVYGATPNTHRVSESDAIDGAQGLEFQCPACAAGKPVEEEDGRRFVRGVHFVLIHFANPINAPVASPDVDHNPRWTMSGNCLGNLTLTPSINLDCGPEPRGCRWHGWVTNGEAR